jgi:hypothetical protein
MAKGMKATRNRKIVRYSGKAKADLNKSGITPTTARACGLEQLDSKQTTKATRRERNGQSLLIPYYGIDGKLATHTTKGKQVPYCAIRLYEDGGRIGFRAWNQKKDGKYWNPSGTSTPPYFPPILDWREIAANPREYPTLYIVEGEKAAIKACQEGYRAFSVGGVWGFKQRERGNSGKKFGSTVHPEFENIDFSGREVLAQFDGDVLTNANVLEGLCRLQKELRSMGASKVWLKILSDGLGMDDFLTSKGKDAYEELERIDPMSLHWIARTNEEWAICAEGGKSLIWREEHNPDIDVTRWVPYTANEFKIALANQFYKVKDDNRQVAPNWLKHALRREYKGFIFDPSKPTEWEGFRNIWSGYGVEAKPGRSYSRLKKHLFRDFCQGDPAKFDYLWAWMAFNVQNPGLRAEVALLLRGGRGVGKTLFVNAYGKLFGPHYMPISNPLHWRGSFNAFIRDKALIFLDEAQWAGDRDAESALKGMITDDVISTEEKYKPKQLIKNRASYIIAGNPQRLAPAGEDERRFFALEVSDTHAQDTGYFGKMIRQLENGGYEALLYDLMHYDYAGVDLRNPPKTDALLKQKLLTLRYENSLAWYLYDCLRNACMNRRDNDWGENGTGRISRAEFRAQYLKFCKDYGVKSPASSEQVGRILKEVFAKELKEDRRRVRKEKVSDLFEHKKPQWNYVFPSIARSRELFAIWLAAENDDFDWPDE